MIDTRDALRAALRSYAAASALPSNDARARARVAAARAIHDAIVAGPIAPVVYTLPLVVGPIPRKPAMGDALRTHAPFLRVRHRGLLVQCLHNGGVRTLLWNPTDVRHALRIPAFDALRHGAGRVAAATLLDIAPPVAVQIAQLGIRADNVDVLAYDQMDGQYPSAMLARFPRARMAVTAEEWSRLERPTPRDSAFIVHGPEIDRARVQVVDRTWLVGDGVVLVQTGGRRPGHLALVANTARGVMVAAGNALSVDGYVPTNSRLPGLPSYARMHHTPHVGAYPRVGDPSYEAMAIEYALADRHPTAPGFPFVIPTVEIVPSLVAPGVTPAVLAPDLALGTVVRV
jgi:hypothetical protein